MSKKDDDAFSTDVYFSGGGSNPMMVDYALRQALQVCLTMLPKSEKTPEKLGQHLRHRLDRLLRDYAEDQALFTEGPH